MRIVACQLDCAWEDKKSNYARARSLLDAARPPAGALVILPEMFATGFSMNVAAIHEGEPSETESFLASAAKSLGVFILGGLVTMSRDRRGRNEAVVFNPDGKLICRYAKLHPFGLSGEAEHYAAGTEIVSFSCQGFVVAPFICYDLRFPEAFRIAVRRGVHLMVVIANWPSKRVSHWVTLLQARAIENQAYVVGVNRVGHDPKLAYPGRSLILDPHGNVLAEGSDREELIGADLDLATVTSWRSEFPALADIRPKLIGSLS